VRRLQHGIIGYHRWEAENNVDRSESIWKGEIFYSINDDLIKRKMMKRDKFYWELLYTEILCKYLHSILNSMVQSGEGLMK
jgi:hypothetical protein